MRLGKWVAVLALGLAALAAPGVRADSELPALTGEVLLTVTGLDPAKFPDGKEEFDMPRLEALGAEELKTSTIWTDGVHDFTGVPLKDLLTHLGVTSTEGMLSAVALNDYAVEIPLADAHQDGPLLAYRMDGEAMSVRDKGPLWIVYPYDQDPEYRTEVVYTRSIWQLSRLEVTP